MLGEGLHHSWVWIEEPRDHKEKHALLSWSGDMYFFCAILNPAYQLTEASLGKYPIALPHPFSVFPSSTQLSTFPDFRIITVPFWMVFSPQSLQVFLLQKMFFLQKY